MKIDCVILNYNDAKTVERLVRQIEHFCCFHRIVLVDNDSTDDSWERLKALDSPRTMRAFLTERGRSEYAEPIRAVLAAERDAVAIFSDEEQRWLTEAMARYIDALDTRLSALSFR